MEINKRLLTVCRAVHIYLTMLGLVVMMLFGITGYTINHEDWFGALTPRVVESEGQVPLPLIAQNDDLKMVEHLRETMKLRGAVTSFADLDDEIAVSFKEPSETWEITITKATGKLTARQELYNFTATVNNLHRGRHTGMAWRWVIDFSAVLIVLACLTGFVLWLALPRRRQLGIAFLVAGTIGTVVAIYFFIPGPDTARPARRAGAPPAESTGR